MEEPVKQKASSKGLLLRPKKMKSMLDEVSQQMYLRNFELAQTNKMLSLLREIDSLALESHDKLTILCGQIAEAVAKANDYPFVGVLSHNVHNHTDLEFYGWFASRPNVAADIDVLKRLRVSTNQDWFKTPERHKYIVAAELSDKELAEATELTLAEAKQLRAVMPVSGFYIAKLTARDQLVGLLLVGFQGASELLETDKAFLERITEPLGVAMDNQILFEENQRVLSKLQKTNEKLKALDETKDEFISMASHQLRTPLTSVKGYLSMVLDGDAGELNDTQKKLLDQAFISSQRMVYLIADLLNVSRLRTGKFIIETAPTNLADVVEGEISQLTETAKGRGLTLTYKKPKNFPLLMLDETKIRQVVMNFADNAIYYTPTGGHINVEVKDTGKSIEFRVIDNGLGVPKSEQPHLFGKFFRAGNAKKARPDGTGLGLFMARKVVIAQKGAIIFTSQEGKGSTFGFSFDKAKLQAPDDKDHTPAS